MNALRLAWLHLTFYGLRSCLIVGCLAISLLVPLVLRAVVPQIEAELNRRARQTPVVIGASGSPLDLTLHGLYFRASELQTIPFARWQQINRGGFAEAVPLHVRFHVESGQQRLPIVGTHLEYFQLRGLALRAGAGLERIGDCVLGADAAQALGLEVGDQVLSTPKSFLSIAADYPLRMNVRGVLQRAGTPDDQAVFVDLKTAWVIENLGHGHQDVTQSNDPNLVLEKTTAGTVASAAVLPYTEITEDNLASFHFHGDVSQFPITAVVVLSGEQKQQDLVAGFATRQKDLQVVFAQQTISQLIAVLFQVQWLLLFVVLFVAVATFCLFGMVIGLTMHIRKAEMDTMFKLGASRGFTAAMHASEILLLLGSAFGIAFALSELLSRLLSGGIYQWWT